MTAIASQSKPIKTSIQKSYSLGFTRNFPVLAVLVKTSFMVTYKENVMNKLRKLKKRYSNQRFYI